MTRGQSLLVASLVALVVHSCGPDAARTVLVEADTTGSPLRLDTVAEEDLGETPALEEGSAEEGLGEGSSDSADRGAGSWDEGERRSSRSASTGDARGGGDPVPDEVGNSDRPPPPILLPSGRVVLPAGIILAAELGTPLHTATTLVGDRFAARLTQAVAAGGRVVIPVGALVEGRVSHIGNADEPGHIAFLHLEARKVQLADGRRLRITADVLDMTGQEVVEPGRDDRRRRGVRNGQPQTEAAAEARRAMLGSILIGLAGRVIVAPKADKEIVVPAGTTFTLQLTEPLEIPGEAVGPSRAGRF